MKGFIHAGIIILLLMVVVPLAIGLAGPGKKTGGMDVPENKITVPKSVKVWIDEKSKPADVDFEEYVACVVASEMPADFGEEALKAQAVAARTYAMAKILKYEESLPENHPAAPLCNTTHCQVYKTEKELISCHQEGWGQEGWEKIKKACKETKGELLYYDGNLVMQPLFFSSSGGQTENSEDVFSGAYPYLVSVSSPYEEGASHLNEQKTFTLDEMRKKLKAAYGEKDTGQLRTDNIKILSRTAGGRVDRMQIGDATFKGTEVRTALGLSSALFSIAFEGSGKDAEITFTSNGSGHGVGMSQYGARGMAREGKTYKEILTHYYTGTVVY